MLHGTRFNDYYLLFIDRAVERVDQSPSRTSSTCLVPLALGRPQQSAHLTSPRALAVGEGGKLAWALDDPCGLCGRAD